jgi:hypothetical protein
LSTVNLEDRKQALPVLERKPKKRDIAKALKKFSDIGRGELIFPPQTRVAK